MKIKTDRCDKWTDIQQMDEGTYERTKDGQTDGQTDDWKDV